MSKGLQNSIKSSSTCLEHKMQFFNSKTHQKGPTWAQLGPKNRFEKDPDKEAPQNYLNVSQKSVPGPQLRPNKASKFACKGSKFVYKGSKLAPKPSQIQAF